ncbi:MAG: hypothetical protein AAF206_15640 [Bacteroidota bacterium]
MKTIGKAIIGIFSIILLCFRFCATKVDDIARVGARLADDVPSSTRYLGDDLVAQGRHLDVDQQLAARIREIRQGGARTKELETSYLEIAVEFGADDEISETYLTLLTSADSIEKAGPALIPDELASLQIEPQAFSDLVSIHYRTVLDEERADALSRITGHVFVPTSREIRKLILGVKLAPMHKEKFENALAVKQAQLKRTAGKKEALRP